MNSRSREAGKNKAVIVRGKEGEAEGEYAVLPVNVGRRVGRSIKKRRGKPGAKRSQARRRAGGTWDGQPQGPVFWGKSAKEEIQIAWC